MPRPTPHLSPDELAAIVAQAAGDFWEGLAVARAALLGAASTRATAEALAPLRRLFHSVSGLMPSLGLREVGFIARTGEALVLMLPEQPAVLPLVQEVLTELEVLMAELKPAAEPGAVSAVSPTTDSKDRDGARTVLVVDDDKASMLLVQSSLAYLGLRVILCNSAVEALEVLDREQPDLTILDVLMPGVDGFELCQRIRLRTTYRYMPILFLSAATALEERVRGLSVGGDDFLPKPFESRELAARVSTHLQRVATMRELSIRDALTGIYNRGYFDERLGYEIRRTRRTRELFTLVILDLDFFKKVNDRYGHQAGDAVLAHTARALSSQFRGTDLIFRYGGEEFAVILVGTHGESAQLTVERACVHVAQSPLTHVSASGAKVEISLTLSAGVASYREGESPEQLIGRADRALYAAKEAGRNRVVVEEQWAGEHR